MEGEDKITIITAENDEPAKKESDTTTDMEGVPQWAKDLKASMDKLQESVTKPEPQKQPEPPSKSSTIPQPPPAPKKEPEAQPVKSASLLGKIVKFLF